MLLLSAACARPAVVAPSGMFLPATREQMAAAADRTLAPGYQLLRFNWRSDDGTLQLSGNGAVRIAPPDSLRVDIRAPLGLGRATLIVRGDSAAAQPADLVDKVLPDRFALWAALGVMRMPPGATAFERLEDGGRQVWRVTDQRGRVTVFDLRGDTLQSVTREAGGRTESQLRLQRDAAGAVRRAQLTDVAHAARFDITVTAREASEAFPATVWRLR